MAIRKDSKGRFLRRGETQRKDGRYCSRPYTEGEEGRPLPAGA